MSFYILGPERKHAPQEYQDHVRAIGGLNRYGDPNFRITWGQTEWEFVYGTDAEGRHGQHPIYTHGGVPAWFIEVWKPPECFGSPEMWYAMSWDAATNMHVLGEYPWRGKYMPASFNLYVKKYDGPPVMEDGVAIGREIRIEAMPLNHYIIDLTVPNLLKEIDETFTQKKNALERIRQVELAKARALAEAAYLDAAPAFDGKAGTHESNREAWMARIARAQKGMKVSGEEIKRRMGIGHRQI